MGGEHEVGAGGGGRPSARGILPWALSSIAMAGLVGSAAADPPSPVSRGTADAGLASPAGPTSGGAPAAPPIVASSSTEARIVSGYVERLAIRGADGRKVRRNVVIEETSERVPWTTPAADDRLGRICFHTGCLEYARLSTRPADVPTMTLVGERGSCTAPVEATLELAGRGSDTLGRTEPDAIKIRAHVVGECEPRSRARFEFGVAAREVRVHGLADAEWRRVPRDERAAWLSRGGLEDCTPSSAADLEVLEVTGRDVALARAACGSIAYARGHVLYCGVAPYAVVAADAATFLLYSTAEEDGIARIDPAVALPCNARPVEAPSR